MLNPKAWCWWLIWLLCTPAFARAERVMLIMDDIGYNLQAGIAVAHLPFPLTLAIIPFSPHAEEIAAVARANGKEVIVHSPMASLDGRMVDPGGLVPGMSKAEFDNALLNQLAAVPFATGLNNHMGSLLTQQPQSMIWLMQMLKQHQLYFIDSRTTADTVAGETAMAAQVPTWQRDIFLDHDRDAVSINQQIDKLAPMAERKGLVVAIGHPYPETINALTETWQRLNGQGIEFVSPSNLISEQLLARRSALSGATPP